MNIKITSNQLQILKESFEVSKNINEEQFEKEVKLFLHNYLTNVQQNNFWKLNGLVNSDVLRLLGRFSVVIKNEDGQIMIPKKNFERKVQRLYWHLFSDNDIITEDGEGNTAGGVGGSFEAPFGGIQRRNFSNI